MAQASISLSKARALNPNTAVIFFAQGHLALRDSQPKQAILDFEQGLKLDPKNADAYFGLGTAHILHNNIAAALASFEIASGLRKGFWEAINNQALVLFEMGRNRDAIERWNQALQIEANSAEASLALAAALNSSGSAAEALRLAKKALTREPSYVLEAYQKEQLWGAKLRAATRQLLDNAELKPIVNIAISRSQSTKKTY
jgi:tetratricopeptide (TPR) repeat protein